MFCKTSNFQSKFATTNSNFEKNNYLGMHYCITYMYINFQQTRASRSVQTVHTYIYLQIIATCINLQLPIVMFKKSTLSNMHHRKTYMYINFQQNCVSRSVKTCKQIYLRKNHKLHKFATNILKKVCANL